MDKSAPLLFERGFGDQGLPKYRVYTTRGTPQTGREASGAAGNAVLGRQCSWEMPQEKHQRVALRREGSHEAQLLCSIPCKHPAADPSAGPGLPRRLSWQDCCKQDFFPPVLCISGSLQDAVKPFIGKEGKGFTTVFKSSPGSRANLPRHAQFRAAHAIWAAQALPGSGGRGQQHPRSPSSRPRTPLGHSTLGNGLSAKPQRRPLQKRNKIEHNEEQRVCRATRCSGKTPSWLRAAPAGSGPDLPPSCHAAG